MFRTFKSENLILWRQVWGLAALLAAIVLCFNAYGFYQPKILAGLGFTQLSAILVILQGLFAAILEPLVGGFSDRILRRVGSRLPQISVGVTLTGLIFALLSWLLSGNIPEGLRWIVPVLMMVWVMSTIVFRGPAIALLIQFAPLDQLPQASSIIVLVLGLVAAANPLLVLLLERMGATPTFLCGAIALLLGAFCLYSQTPQHRVAPFPTSKSQPISLQRLVLLFLIGFAAGFESNILFGIFCPILSESFPATNSGIIGAIILAISALSANLWGDFVTQYRPNHSMQSALGAMALLMGLTLLIGRSTLIHLVTIFALGLAFGLAFTATIPLALSSVPTARAGLGTGIYFGGSGAGLALFSLWMQQARIVPIAGAMAGASAFFVARFCLQRLNRL
ncbi:MFS transporter [Oscillatoria sp. FACHB-1406]|uniref:MFS transporter n=1 Tax=Oscillatoria sp. FACHB-1406 TaxID=2692846 RepID=UPI0016883F3E|nr:MFS transporter [Oscillatoria sp. FACHB-1406]MBD2577394.1 MFS transporter [Oscillatoria sp. FACHB-1406]